jgi:hypothetical protein
MRRTSLSLKVSGLSKVRNLRANRDVRPGGLIAGASLFKIDAGLPYIQFATILKFVMAGLESRVWTP